MLKNILGVRVQDKIIWIRSFPKPKPKKEGGLQMAQTKICRSYNKRLQQKVEQHHNHIGPAYGQARQWGPKI